jgi:hypothetical protein
MPWQFLRFLQISQFETAYNYKSMILLSVYKFEIMCRNKKNRTVATERKTIPETDNIPLRTFFRSSTERRPAHNSCMNTHRETKSEKETALSVFPARPEGIIGMPFLTWMI